MAILAQLYISQVCIFIVSVRFRKLWQREWKVKRHFKSLQKCHWRDSFEDWKKNKISNKNSKASSYHIFLSPNPHISYPRNPLSSVFCHYWMKSSLNSHYSILSQLKSTLNSHYSVTLLNAQLFKLKLYIGGGLKSLHLMRLVLNMDALMHGIQNIFLHVTRVCKTLKL